MKKLIYNLLLLRGFISIKIENKYNCTLKASLFDHTLFTDEYSNDKRCKISMPFIFGMINLYPLFKSCIGRKGFIIKKLTIMSNNYENIYQSIIFKNFKYENGDLLINTISEPISSFISYIAISDKIVEIERKKTITFDDLLILSICPNSIIDLKFSIKQNNHDN